MRPMKVRGKGRIACVFWALGTALVLGGCQRGADAKPLKLTFSQESGCYENPFELELSTEKGDIYYTLDGSDPRDSDTRIAYKGAISVTDRSGDANVLSAIDPAQYDAVNVEWDSEKQDFVSTIGNPKDDEVDKMTVVRAVAQSSGRSMCKELSRAAMRPARTWRLCLSQSIPQICLTPKPEFMLRVTFIRRHWRI